MAQIVLRAVAALSVASVVLGAVQPAQAAVSKDYARDTWDNSKCKAFPFEQGLVTGDITGDGRSDAVMLWACSPGAERRGLDGTGSRRGHRGDGARSGRDLERGTPVFWGAYPRALSYWIDGQPIKQKSLTTPLPQAYGVRLKDGRVIVKGGDYSGVGVPLCCADVRVTLTYEWNGRRLVLVDEKRRPLG